MNDHFARRKLQSLIFRGLLAFLLLCGLVRAAEEGLQHPLDIHLSDSYQDDLPGLMERKYIRVLTTMNRTNFFLTNGKFLGFEYALLKEYENQLNQGIGRGELKVSLEFIPVSRDCLLPGVAEGYGDIAAAGLTITEKRREKVERFRPLFEKYANRYHFDWRLILAMAFQESRLNPKEKSPRGAVGLMQVRPSSAADPNVDIQNVQNLENNVHAAVKYLDFLRERYFSDANIRPRDRVRFSLASYNAGPARILQARKKASAMNLAPNRWFRNVELAVLQMVGQETVSYVSNINKYYVIYKHALGNGADVR